MTISVQDLPVNCYLYLLMVNKSHLRTLVINIEAPGVIVILVGELQPVRMTNLLWLKGGIQVLDRDYSFRAFGLLDRKYTDVHISVSRKDATAGFN